MWLISSIRRKHRDASKFTPHKQRKTPKQKGNSNTDCPTDTAPRKIIFVTKQSKGAYILYSSGECYKPGLLALTERNSEKINGCTQPNIYKTYLWSISFVLWCRGARLVGLRGCKNLRSPAVPGRDKFFSRSVGGVHYYHGRVTTFTAWGDTVSCPYRDHPTTALQSFRPSAVQL